MIENLVLGLFFFLLFIIFLYSLAQLHLLSHFFKSRKNQVSEELLDLSAEVPFVTVQLPIYNEKKVVERLLKNIAELTYPSKKLEIQVLDDSTDDSVHLTASLISELRSSGIKIRHIRRNNREGFKAGALKVGLESAKGEFIAVFDSDFLPEKDWLLKTLPHFKARNIGVVQTRWGHLNRNFSLLTKLQAFLLDYHFVLEQSGRNQGKHFINFNGTAGIWRKACILDAGNWNGETLTEDLDLSYRAQLKGWKFVYLQSVETKAELPVTISAARSQQFRWNKGAAENFQKNYYKLFSNSRISAGTKLHSFFHLLNSSLFFILLLLALTSLPLLLQQVELGSRIEKTLGVFFGMSSLIFFVSYFTTYLAVRKNNEGGIFQFSLLFFLFFSIAMGFSLHNSIAVLEGHFGKRSEFIRTPKFNLSSQTSLPDPVPLQVSWQLLCEILLMLFFGGAVLFAFFSGYYSFLLFHFMLFFGFSYVVFNSLQLERFFLRKKLIAKEI